MKYWIQYLQPSALNANELIDACGDQGVFILDGRNSQRTMIQDGHNRAHVLRYRYPAFVVCTGPRLFQESRRTSVQTVKAPA